MKKKGFTLIELLAVIVILAIIALIAIPLIGNVIEKAKIGALENSVNGLVESANMYYANQSIKGEQQTETIFDFANGEQTNSQKLEYKGKVYNGKLILHANGKVAVCIDDKEHYAYKNKDSDEIISGVGTCLYDGPTGDFSSNSPVEDIKKQVAAATATSDKVLEGSTIYTLSGLVAGTMANNASKTLSSTNVTESDDKINALITIPSGGYYDETSQISVPIETIKDNVSSLNINYVESNSETIPFYPISYAWSWDNSSNTSRCTITYKFLIDCNITSASGDFSNINGNHLAGETFTIVKTSNFGAPSSGKSATISGGDSIKWKSSKTVPFYPISYAWSWDDSSNTSRCIVTYKYVVHCNITDASGDFSNINGNHLAGETFTITKTSNYGAPSSGKSATISGGDSINWKLIKLAIVNDY